MTKSDVMDPTAVSENYSSSRMTVSVTKTRTVCISSNRYADVTGFCILLLIMVHCQFITMIIEDQTNYVVINQGTNRI